MISFENDYNTGAHPEVLKRLCETNAEQLSGYGTDRYCESAKDKIRAAIGDPEAEVEFLVGGTQTNAAVISAMLGDHEGVVAADTGHLSMHEAGAIEFTGHKVLTLPHVDGKIDPGALNNYLKTFFADPNHDHMVFPGMVYISHPTEFGTLYTKDELASLSSVCHAFGLPLYLDGARLGYGLMSRDTDVTISDIARLCDVFYIGGTKMGALCGEAVVFKKGVRPRHFMTSIKRRGALLAKGRLIGVQFDALFTDGLYMKIGRHAIDMAERLKAIFKAHGIPFFIDSPTNQQFVIMENGALKRLSERIVYSTWERYDDDHTVVRFVTGWSTGEEDLAALEEALDDICPAEEGRKYYEAYDERYRAVHKLGRAWASLAPTPALMDLINTYHVDKKAKLLEIGCGEGRDARAVLLAGYDELTAADVSPEAISYCREKMPEFAGRFAVCDCLSCAKLGEFDLIYSVAVLHMLVEDEDRKRFYAFIKRNLAKDGLAFIFTMGDGEREFATDPDRAFDTVKREHPQGDVMVASTSCRVVSFDTFERELADNGFKILETGLAECPPEFDMLMYAVVRQAE